MMHCKKFNLTMLCWRSVKKIIYDAMRMHCEKFELTMRWWCTVINYAKNVCCVNILWSDDAVMLRCKILLQEWLSHCKKFDVMMQWCCTVHSKKRCKNGCLVNIFRSDDAVMLHCKKLLLEWETSVNTYFVIICVAEGSLSLFSLLLLKIYIRRPNSSHCQRS